MAPETPKGVSSRLLTMKFMQRAIASNSTATTPESEKSSSKKRKLDHGSPAGRLSMDFDQASVDAAMQAQEAKRKAALQQHATGDTHWVLNTKFEKPAAVKAAKAPRRIVYVGYGDIDSENESGDGEDSAAIGRTSTIKPKPKNESSRNPSDDESGDDSGDNTDDSEDSNPRKRKESGSSREQSRSRSKSRPRPRPTAADIEAKELRDKRRKKEVRLNNITSISGAGDNSPGSNKSMTCYNCHQPGHRASDCQRRKSGGREFALLRFPLVTPLSVRRLTFGREKITQFGMYVMFPIGIMYYFGTNLDNRFSVPDFWPRPEECNKLPRDRDELKVEYERMIARQRFRQARLRGGAARQARGRRRQRKRFVNERGKLCILQGAPAVNHLHGLCAEM
ncbi:hypothetical protein NLG97_g2995 [Lecanicillium saksenae]|uniref:Uncharacterized protein n=1 Tax=Lecanicillium saksenae TaxID=468837 RepID=A0ACC1R1Z6_9HYPO|nr:hypothetical protein NLG97_g2995 [Lecanicillium saksenae]